MLALVFLLSSLCVNAQNSSKSIAVVLGIDSKGVINNSESVSYMVRLELEKTNIYTVMDKYDVAELVQKKEYHMQ